MSETSFKTSVQRVGRSLSAMVMPNIGAFVAWGLITALFIDTGWLPNAALSSMVGPMLSYLLPILVAYTAGKNVAGKRGALIAAIASIGVIVGTTIPMFLGVMIFGPLAAFVIKKFDKAIEGKVPQGFEMLVENYSVGIIGMLLAILGYFFIGPVVETITGVLSAGATIIYNAGFLPLISIFVEPAKILFLNNAINHGIMGPLGLEQSAQLGKSIMFLIETNPGPGLGIILAYWMFGRGDTKSSAPGAAIIHFFGGIHEIYFPYVMMNPALLLAVICGGITGVFTFSLLGTGLVASPSPGSIFALLAMAPKGEQLNVIIGVLVSCAVSFLVASVFVKRGTKNEATLEEAKAAVTSSKAQSKGLLTKVDGLIVFACDAGMGSSAMGATSLRKKLTAAGIDAKVVHSAVDEIPSEATYVLTQKTLAERAKLKAPNAYLYTVENFMDSKSYDKFIEELTSKQ